MTNNSDQKPPDEKENKREFLRYLGVASTVGINFVASTFIGFAIGHWVLDKYLDTSPWFTIIFLLLGIAAGFKYLFRIASRGYDDKDGNSERGN
ncbi:MAG: AtpZ/AtpI family protein [Nitrospiraceae bacterium]|nr:MAG: AtpZ/AtpI family protein [Nitrospiraceae bacterium]